MNKAVAARGRDYTSVGRVVHGQDLGVVRLQEAHHLHLKRHLFGRDSGQNGQQMAIAPVQTIVFTRLK